MAVPITIEFGSAGSQVAQIKVYPGGALQEVMVLSNVLSVVPQEYEFEVPTNIGVDSEPVPSTDFPGRWDFDGVIVMYMENGERRFRKFDIRDVVDSDGSQSYNDREDLAEDFMDAIALVP